MDRGRVVYATGLLVSQYRLAVFPAVRERVAPITAFRSGSVVAAVDDTDPGAKKPHERRDRPYTISYLSNRRAAARYALEAPASNSSIGSA